MKGWFGIRVAVILGLSVFTFFLLNPSYLMVWNLPVPLRSLHPFTWVVISIIWTLGLFTVRWQYQHLESVSGLDATGHQPGFNLREFLKQQQHERTGNMDRKGKNLGQLVQAQAGSEDPQPGMMPDRNNGVDLGKVVEGVLTESLADAELSMELTLPSGKTLHVMGEDLKVKKGSIKIKPRKPAGQQIEDLFGKSRKKRA